VRLPHRERDHSQTNKTTERTINQDRERSIRQQHHLVPIPGRLRSAFRARRTATGTLFDFILATEEGDLVAELREVEFDTPVA
jgi:hypothetical protein